MTALSPAAAPAEAAIPAPAGGGRAGQWLLRAEVSGEEGSASLRLLLRRFGSQRFLLTAADALGQARWEVRRDGGEAIWLDPQAKLFCRLDSRLPLQARLAMPSIAVADFPELLTGEWPPADRVAPEPSALSAERPFTAEANVAGRAGAWRSWTLWQAGEPVAWFKRADGDSLLSVRRPSVQMRWRVTAASDLPAEEAGTASWPGALPAGSREMSCPDNAIP